MRDHVPVETDKEYGFEAPSDEEAPVEKALTKDGDNIVVTESTTPQDNVSLRGVKVG